MATSTSTVTSPSRSTTAIEDVRPAVSVVLPVLNEARDIRRVLDEIVTQEPPEGGFEVIVADGGSSDGTRGIVSELSDRHPFVKLVHNPGRLSSAGRNVGAAMSRGRYVVFVDGHCRIPRPDYLQRLVDVFEQTGAACLSRPQPMDRLDDGAWSSAISTARHSWLGHNPGSDIYGGEPGPSDPRHAGAAYTREAFERLGGYDERFDACEDVEFNHRVADAKLPSYRHPDLAVHYRPRSSLMGLFRQVRRYGRGRARLMARHPDVVPWPILAVVVAAVLIPPILLVIHPAAGLWWSGGLATGWLAVTTTESLRQVGPRPHALRVIAAMFAIHAGMVVGFLRGALEFHRFRRPPRGR